MALQAPGQFQFQERHGHDGGRQLALPDQFVNRDRGGAEQFDDVLLRHFDLAFARRSRRRDLDLGRPWLGQWLAQQRRQHLQDVVDRLYLRGALVRAATVASRFSQS